MNLQLELVNPPVRVSVFNGTSSAGQLLIYKILSGYVFGRDQKIDLTILVLSREEFKAEHIRQELINCAFPNTYSITISNDIPSVTDADVFCYITNFPNPNLFDLDTDEQQVLKCMKLLINVASNITGPLPVPKKNDENLVSIKKRIEQLKTEKKVKKPIFLSDGLVALDILKSLSKEMPSDVFFCPTTLPAVAKSVLGDYLKLKCDLINDLLVWAAHDTVFNLEFNKPLILDDEVDSQDPCDWELVSNERLKSFNLDYTHFGPSWMKKEYVEKVMLMASKNPYGSICKASELAYTLHLIWKARSKENGIKVCANIGIISDGSLETIKGFPYVLPLILHGESCIVDQRFKEDPHLKLEIKRINNEVYQQHLQLMAYCKKFLQDKCVTSCQSSVEEESDLETE